MFVFWELVGLCSYLLIGYWYTRPTAARAAVKAFWITKLGDLGFVIGIVMLWSATGTFEFRALFAKAQEHALAIEGLGTIMFLVYLGAVGKSAQFPLHVWLPDAMEGPTPVSALIHAATMVTAGVFMVTRAQPQTGVVFIVGTLALAGLPPLAGFFSKEAILAGVWEADMTGPFLMLALTALLTAFYMFRVVFVAFFGRAPAAGHPHEPSWTMRGPLWVLAALSVLVGIRLAIGSVGEHHGPGWLPPLSVAAALGGIGLAWARSGERRV